MKKSCLLRFFSFFSVVQVGALSAIMFAHVLEASTLNAPYWSPRGSEERTAPMECEQGGAAVGFSCRGAFCDDVMLLCDTSYNVTFPRQWSETFSDDRGAKMAECDDGMFVTGLTCDGGRCGDLKVKCSKVEDHSHEHCFWGDRMVTSADSSERRYWFPEGYALAGLRCIGDSTHCDELEPKLCTNDVSLEYNMPPVPYQTGLTLKDEDPARCEKGAAIGLGAEGGFSGRVSFFCDPRIETTENHTTLEGNFSEEGVHVSQICPTGSLLSGIECNGSKRCDNMTLTCVEIADYNRDAADCHWNTRPMSDKQKAKYDSFYFDEQWAMAGLRCEGRYCDNMYAYLCKKPQYVK